MNKIKTVINFICTVLCVWAICNITYASALELKPGDLLFQDLDCGTLCDSIGEVTYGVNNTYISHVAMVISTDKENALVIEASSHGVVETPLNKFLDRSHDSMGKPMIIVERVIPKYQKLIPKAIQYAKLQLGKPYNDSFVPNNGKSYYCSELIYQIFLYANNGESIFHTHKMSFNDPKTGHITRDWQEYFKQLKVPVPEGMIGTNPGMLSRESALIIVGKYGNLRVHNQ